MVGGYNNKRCLYVAYIYSLACYLWSVDTVVVADAGDDVDCKINAVVLRCKYWNGRGWETSGGLGAS